MCFELSFPIFWLSQLSAARQSRCSINAAAHPCFNAVHWVGGWARIFFELSSYRRAACRQCARSWRNSHCRCATACSFRRRDFLSVRWRCALSSVFLYTMGAPAPISKRIGKSKQINPCCRFAWFSTFRKRPRRSPRH